MVPIVCPECSRKLKVAENVMGKTIKCPACSAKFVARQSNSNPPAAAGATPKKSTPAAKPPPSKAKEAPPTPPKKAPVAKEEEFQEEQEELEEDEREEEPEGEEEEQEGEVDRKPKKKKKVKTGAAPSKVLRIVVLVLGILGGVCSGLLGFKWLSDYNELKGLIEFAREGGGGNPQAREALAEIDKLHTATFLLLAALPMGIAGGVVALKGKGLIAAGLMLIAGVAPVIFTVKALLTTGFLLLAGGLSFLVKPGGKG